MIRNAGGRASDDAIRSLVISHKLLGTLEWFVIHHTDCGMEPVHRRHHFRPAGKEPGDRPGRRFRLARRGHRPGLVGGPLHQVAAFTNNEQSVVEDVERIRSAPLVPKNIPVYGYIYDVRTGRLVEVPQATAAGKPVAA